MSYLHMKFTMSIYAQVPANILSRVLPRHKCKNTVNKSAVSAASVSMLTVAI